MNKLLLILLSTFSISLIAWIGVLVLFFKEAFLKKIILFLVSFSAGALIGGAFFHLLPEAIEELGFNFNIFIYFVLGFSIFFFLEQFISWHHCHQMPNEHKKPFTYLVLISDAVHNFIDGIVIGVAFLVDIKVGMATWLAVLLHEVPQELGDFGILIHGGWQKNKALLFNFLSALTIVLGGILAYFMNEKLEIIFLLPFAAGSFTYIASSDLIPEIKNHKCLKNNILHFLFLLLGLILTLGIIV